MEAVEQWRLWHELAVSDPSAADLYRTNFWADIVIALALTLAAWLAHRLLRPRRDQP